MVVEPSEKLCLEDKIKEQVRWEMRREMAKEKVRRRIIDVEITAYIHRAVSMKKLKVRVQQRLDPNIKSTMALCGTFTDFHGSCSVC